MTEHEELMEDWKERLGLHDWKIRLEDNCEPAFMAGEDCCGCTDWTEAIKAAKIQILDEKFYGTRIIPFDYEKTLVHELLHLKFSLVADNVEPLQARLMHQIIDDLARAFVDTKMEALNGKTD